MKTRQEAFLKEQKMRKKTMRLKQREFQYVPKIEIVKVDVP